MRSLDSQVFLEILNILGFLCRLEPHVSQYAVLWWSKFLQNDVTTSANWFRLPDFVFLWCFKLFGTALFEYITLAHFPVALITVYLSV